MKILKLTAIAMVLGSLSSANAFTLNCCQTVGALIPSTTADMEHLRILGVKTCDTQRGRFLHQAVQDGKITIVKAGACSAAWAKEYYSVVDRRNVKLDVINAETPAAKKSK